MKKIIFLCMLLIFMTGCTANYNLEVDKNFKYRENLELKAYKSDFEIAYDSVNDGINNIYNEINSYLSNPIYEYKVNKKLNDDVYVNFNNKYSNITELLDSPFLKNAKAKFEEYETEDGYTAFQILIDYDFYDWINTNKYVTVPINEMNVNITFPYKVISTNADSVDGNTYTWNLKKLITQRSFYIEYDKNKLAKDNNNILLILSIIAVSIIGIVSFLIMENKNKSKI